MNEDWRKNVSPIGPEEAHINPPHLQRLNYNPYYYTPDEKDLKIGDDVVIGTYASDLHGSPNIRWTETKIIGLPLHEYYHPYLTVRKYCIKLERKAKLEKLHNKI